MIAVIIPVHNSRNTIDNALKSLKAQTHKFFMTFMIDDASNETYDDIIEKYNKYGLKINYFRKDTNSGPGDTRQYGLNLLYKSELPFEYVFFMDSDDTISPLALEWLYDTAKKNNLDVCRGNIMDQNGEPLEEGTVNVSPVGKLYKLDFIKSNNITFPPYFLSEDTYFNRMCDYIGGKIASISQFIYFYCNNKNSITRENNSSNRKKYEWQILLVSIQLVEYMVTHYDDKYIKEILYRVSHIYVSDQCIIHEQGLNSYSNIISSLLKNDILAKLLYNNINQMGKIIPCSGPIPYNFYFMESFGQWLKRYGVEI